MHQVNAGRLSDFAAGFGGQGKERTGYVRSLFSVVVGG